VCSLGSRIGVGTEDMTSISEDEKKAWGNDVVSQAVVACEVGFWPFGG
jgi:hypothetical protein